MSNHEALRAALAAANANGYAPTVTVTALDLAEIITHLDCLIGAPKKPAKGCYTPEFESAWADYPTRPGNSKAAAFKAWQARIKAGASAEEMLSGTLKYAAYCKAMKTEPAYVKQAATFYGPGEHFSADWTVPRADVVRAPGRRDAQIETDDQRAARRSRWGLNGLGDSEVPNAPR